MLGDPDMKEFAQEDHHRRIEAKASPAWKRTSSTCSSPTTPPTRRTSSWRSAPRQAVTRPPSSQATCTRCTSASARSRRAGRPRLMDVQPLRCGRLQGNPVQGEGRQGVLGHEVRERRPPRAARTQDRSPRAASTPPPPRWRCCPRPTRWRSTSTRTTCASTCTAPAARAASASTPPTPPCASRTFRRAWSCSRQDQKSQLQNKIAAMAVLRARLYEKMLAEQQAAEGAQAPGADRLGRPFARRSAPTTARRTA